MIKSNNIFLIGPMGAGKTSVGNTLAKKLKKTFIDCDEVMIKKTGVSISWIFDIEGEAGFRQRESKLIAELTEKKNIILATGGGAVLLRENRQHLVNRGFIVYLRVAVTEQLKRVEKSRDRPLLNQQNKEEILLALIKEREPLYCEIADLIIETDHRPIEAITKEIINEYQKG